MNKFELNGDVASVEREIEGGHYAYDITLPALFTVEKGLNTPRYPTLPNIMKAKKKEIREVAVGDLGLADGDITADVVVEGMALPRQDRLNKIIEGDNSEVVSQLLGILREEEKVL